MPGDFNKTHNRILVSAKENFLANGYERANLRKICRDAGITTGAFYRHFSDKEALFAAFVEPVIEGIRKIYFDSQKDCIRLFEKESILAAYDITYTAAASFINYIFDNLDNFKLLLTCADGTKYFSFLDDMVSLETDEREKVFELLSSKNIKFNRIPKKESHLLTHTIFSSMFEVATHDFTREEALQYGHTLSAYCNAGWQAVLGI
ncbi:MAG: TetR/AcrR family transcriptional regulator [Spirochaetales bacterium]|nr:TetR/AcrR family transcriptional regulator [Spirochaetales bacterium]